MYKKNKGFTIVELIVVMAIIAILVLMAVPKIQKYIETARLTSVLATAETIYKAALAYEAANITDPNLLSTRQDGYIDRSFNIIPDEQRHFYPIGTSYLDPYVDGDVHFILTGDLPLNFNSSDVYDAFMVGIPNAYRQLGNMDLTDPIFVFYNDPRLPDREELWKNGLYDYDYFLGSALVNGEPMIVGSNLCTYETAQTNPYHLVPISEYLEKYNKALEEKNK